MNENNFDHFELLQTSYKHIDFIFDKVAGKIVGAWVGGRYLETNEFDIALRELAEKKLHARNTQEKFKIK